MSVDDGRRAFKLVDDISLEELQGASVAYGPLAHLFDIKAALVAGNGTITTNDSVLIGTLAGVECLQPADVPADATLAALPVETEAVEAIPASFTPQEPPAVVADVEAVHAPEPATAEQAVAQAEPAASPASNPNPAPDTTSVSSDAPPADDSASSSSPNAAGKR